MVNAGGLPYSAIFVLLCHSSSMLFFVFIIGVALGLLVSNRIVFINIVYLHMYTTTYPSSTAIG